MATIYVLIDPRDNSIRYVGMTTIPYLSTRLQGHMHDRRDNPRTRWVKELLSLGVRPVIQAVHCASDDDERYWISWFRDNGCDLLNVSTGGPGAPGVPMSDAHKEMLRAQPRNWSHEKREAAAERARNRKHSPETIAKRMAAIAAKRADGSFKKRPRETGTHCRNGHEWDEANTYRNGKGTRICRTCNRERQRARVGRK